MIKLALEAPTSRLATWTHRTDLDFALAHRVLEDETYCRFYSEREDRQPGRELILDNSFHELGEPLPIDDLLTAAELVNANFIISPDRLEDPDWTLEQFDMMSRRTIKTAVVLGGETPEDRRRFLENVRPAAMLCLPYRRSRLEWYLEQLPQWTRIHLLGMSSFEEIIGWRWLADDPRLSPVEFSVDTSKPIKWGLLGRRFSNNDTRSLRGAPITSKDLLGLTGMTQEQDNLVQENIEFLRGLIA